MALREAKPTALVKSKCVPADNNNKGNYLRSESGSETDASGSTDTLNAEEQLVLCHSERQDPQGEEMPSKQQRLNGIDVQTHGQLNRSMESNLSFGSNSNTLIIHHSVPDEPWSHRWLSSGHSAADLARKSLEGNLNDLGPHTSFPIKMNKNATDITSLMSASVPGSGLVNSFPVGQGSFSSATSGQCILLKNSSADYSKGTDLQDIPPSFINQSEVLKHLMRDSRPDLTTAVPDTTVSVTVPVHSTPTVAVMSGGSGRIARDSSVQDRSLPTPNGNLSVPNAYSRFRSDGGDRVGHRDLAYRRSTELMRSNPDLSPYHGGRDLSAKDILDNRLSSSSPDDSYAHVRDMIEILTKENNALKMEVDIYRRKVAKLQRFEQEMVKVEEQHRTLEKMCERREQLERLARHKLHAEVRRLTDVNTELRERIEMLTDQLMGQPMGSEESSDEESLRKELNKRDALIAQLISQNKELVAAKERQEIELTAQKQTLNEQRAHIDILDNALQNSQATVMKFEEEVRKKQNLVDQAGQLRRLLLSMQLASEKREQSEKNLRYKLEKEIKYLRSNNKQEDGMYDLAELRRECREKEEKIMILETEVSKWEQRYLQESAMRQIAIEAAAMPKDAKIAALEKTTQETEKQIALARADKLRHLEEANNLNKQVADLETKNRSLESVIAEKDAMVKVLQRKLEEREILLNNALHNSSHISKSYHGLEIEKRKSFSTSPVVPVSSAPVRMTAPTKVISPPSTLAIQDHELGDPKPRSPSVLSPPSPSGSSASPILESPPESPLPSVAVDSPILRQ